MSQNEIKTTPIPRKVIVVVLIVQFAEAFQLCILLPFIPFMVARFPGVEQEDVGMYSGLVISAFALGQLLSSYFWGMISDRIGEKIVTLISLALTCVASLFFGFSSNVIMAFSIRALTGLLNGNIGVIKTYLGKNTDSTNQGTALALVSAAWVIGTIVAPVFGGILANPVKNYPSIFPDEGFLAEYPYSLPCLCTALVLFISWVASLIMIEDEKFDSYFKNVRVNFRKCLGLKTPKDPFIPIINDTDDEDDDSGYSGHEDLKMEEEEKDKQNEDVELEEEEEESSQEWIESSNDSLMRHGDQSESIEFTEIRLFDKKEIETRLEKFQKKGKNRKSKGEKPGQLSSLPRSVVNQMFFASAMYGGIGYLFIVLDSVYPLFCQASLHEGGLGFNSKDIGISLGIMGIIEFLYILFIFPRINGHVSPMKLLKVSLIIFIPVIMSCPLPHYFGELAYNSSRMMPSSSWLVWTSLIINLGLRGIMSTSIYTPIMMFINNSVPKTFMGRANGVGQSFVALTRTIGPASGGILWSLFSRIALEFHYFTLYIFLFISFCAFIILLATRFYHPDIEIPYDHREDIEETKTKTKTKSKSKVVSS